MFRAKLRYGLRYAEGRGIMHLLYCLKMHDRFESKHGA